MEVMVNKTSKLLNRFFQVYNTKNILFFNYKCEFFFLILVESETIRNHTDCQCYY